MTIDKPSKTARKKEQQELQALGEYLIPLKNAELESIGLNEDLLHAVRVAARMKAHGALRRQKQLIGKLMRQADADRIRARLDALGAKDRAEKLLFAKAEKWRDRLLAEGTTALAAFAELGRCDRCGAQSNCSQSWRSHRNDRTEKTLKRQVFRRVHAILVKISA